MPVALRLVDEGERIDQTAQCDQLVACTSRRGAVTQVRGVLNCMRRTASSMRARSNASGVSTSPSRERIHAARVLRTARAAQGAALPHLAAHAQRCTLRGTEQVRLLGEQHRRRRAAVAQLEEVAHLPQHGPHALTAAERTVVQRIVVADSRAIRSRGLLVRILTKQKARSRLCSTL